MKEKKAKHVAKAKARREKKPEMAAVVRNNVFFIGLDSLDPEDQQQIKDIIFKDYITLERELKGINSLKLHFKQYKKQGKVKYSVHLLIDANTRPIVVDQVYSPVQFDPVATVHLLMQKAKREITHKFKTDTSWRKPYQKGML